MNAAEHQQLIHIARACSVLAQLFGSVLHARVMVALRAIGSISRPLLPASAAAAALDLSSSELKHRHSSASFHEAACARPFCDPFMTPILPRQGVREISTSINDRRQHRMEPNPVPHCRRANRSTVRRCMPQHLGAPLAREFDNLYRTNLLFRCPSHDIRTPAHHRCNVATNPSLPACVAVLKGAMGELGHADA